MTDRKKHKHEEEIVDASAEAVATSENTEQLSAEIDALKKKLEESESRASEYKDGWMRSQAEFQNYRKRIERDIDFAVRLEKSFDSFGIQPGTASSAITR